MFYSFDTETTSKNAHEAKIFAFGICDHNGKVTILRLDGMDGTSPTDNRKKVQAFLDNPSYEKIAHNLKYDLTVLINNGFRINRNHKWHDTMLMSKILRNLSKQHDLTEISYQLFDWPKDLDEEIASLGNALGNYQKIPVKKLAEYLETDVKRAMIIFLGFWPEFKDSPDMLFNYRNEVDLVFTTSRLESFGIALDLYQCDKLTEHLLEELDKVREDTKRIFGEYLNWKSSIVVHRILYDNLKLPVIKATKNDGISTNKDVIFQMKEQYNHPVFDLILKTRSYNNGLAMIKSYRSFADKNNIIRPNVNTLFADTSRQSSSRPNMQNTQKETALKNPFPVPARRVFRCSPGFTLLFVDYKGIEMRLIVDACGQPEMLEVINNDGDVHILSASAFYGELWEDYKEGDRYITHIDEHYSEFKITTLKKYGKNAGEEQLIKYIRKVLRGAAKNAGFAVAYGGGESRIIQTLNLVGHRRGKQAFKSFAAAYPQVASFSSIMKAEVRSKGYIVDAFGIKHEVPRNRPWAASNYRIQRDAAVLLKIAENRVDRYSIEELNDLLRIHVPVHDELIMGLHRSLQSKRNLICQKAATLMTTNIPQIKVKLDVEFKKSATNWADAKEFEFRE
jgi:DNA polymerase I